MGTLGLTSLLSQQAGASAAAGQFPPQFPARAKRIIQLFMPGGPSAIDTFDYKPDIAQHAGERPASVDLRSLRNTKGGLLKSPFEFSQHGETGKWG